MTGVLVRERSLPSTRALLVAAVAGAAFGAAWDLLHVRSHTTIYASGIGRMPFWVPIEFAFVYVVGVSGIALLGSPRPDGASWKRLVREAIWVSLVYAVTAFGHRNEWAVFGACVAGMLCRPWELFHAARTNPIPAFSLIVAGPMVESVLIAAHVFHYTHASLGNIPVWLPLLYANAVPFALRLTETSLWVGRRQASA